LGSDEASSSDPFETMKTPPPKDKPWKQFKSKTPVRSLTPVLNNGIAQSCGEPIAVDSTPVEATAARKGHDNNESPQLKNKAPMCGREDSPLNIEHAPARRLDWTPPICKEKDAGNHSQVPQQWSQSQEGDNQPFNRLLETYKFSESSKDPAATSEDDNGVFRKRKLIECVSVRGNLTAVADDADGAAPAKRKAPKKKQPRTITALATAAYKPATQVDPEPLPVDISEIKTVAEAAASKNTKSKANAKPKRKTAKASKKKVAPPKPVLLSPSTAMRHVANQDFVFGTSSQLAVEHSPTFLRDLASAVRRSNELDIIAEPTPINSDSIEPPEKRDSLWGAAARDGDGDLFDAGVRELTDGTAGLPTCAKQTDPFGYVKDVNGQDENSFLNLSDILEQPAAEAENSRSSPATKDPALVLVDSSPVPELPQEKLPAESQQEPARPQVERDAELLAPPRPKFELYTDAQLSREVASYGFKNIKPRNAQIALLDRCWQSKNQTGSVSSKRQASTLSSAPPRSSARTVTAKSPTKTPIRAVQSSAVSAAEPQEPPPSAQPVESPKRPRGRPRKTAAASPAPAKRSVSKRASSTKSAATPAFPSTPKGKGRSSRVVVEIPDSESEAAAELSQPSSSPSCSSVDETFSPTRGVDMSVSMDEDTEISIALSPSDQPTSFEYIKKAVTTVPRTTDPLQPSWHEKILMYDPIVVEDLAAWLNSGELTRVGYDDEVSSGEVKKWCESKSICCLWKVNLRGKERKRF
jgi:hypothetical protein